MHFKRINADVKARVASSAFIPFTRLDNFWKHSKDPSVPRERMRNEIGQVDSIGSREVDKSVPRQLLASFRLFVPVELPKGSFPKTNLR